MISFQSRLDLGGDEKYQITSMTKPKFLIFDLLPYLQYGYFANVAITIIKKKIRETATSNFFTSFSLLFFSNTFSMQDQK